MVNQRDLLDRKIIVSQNDGRKCVWNTKRKMQLSREVTSKLPACLLND